MKRSNTTTDNDDYLGNTRLNGDNTNPQVDDSNSNNPLVNNNNNNNYLKRINLNGRLELKCIDSGGKLEHNVTSLCSLYDTVTISFKLPDNDYVYQNNKVDGSLFDYYVYTLERDV